MTTTTEYMITDEDRVTIDSDGTLRAYTRGCRDPLYVGTDRDAAADSLEIDREMLTDALMGDPSNDDLRLTDIYRVRDSHTGDVLSTHSTFRAALTAAAGWGENATLAVEELIDGRWVAAS